MELSKLKITEISSAEGLVISMLDCPLCDGTGDMQDGHSDVLEECQNCDGLGIIPLCHKLDLKHISKAQLN